MKPLCHLRTLKLLMGTEVDILADGKLDYPNELLKEFDWVVASIHSGFKQPHERITRRIIAAMQNPLVDCIAHPTGRLLGQRAAYEIDIEEMLSEAARTEERRNETMKKILILLILVGSFTSLLASEFKRYVELEKEIQGDWLAAEYYVAQPPPELQQSIKSMSFRTDNIIEWEYVRDGKSQKANGHYGIYSFPSDQEKPRQLPTLIVTPTYNSNAADSSHVILTLSNVELDFDCRFVQRWGKLIKAKGPDGKGLLFIRKENKISSQQSTAAEPSQFMKELKEMSPKHDGVSLRTYWIEDLDHDGEPEVLESINSIEEDATGFLNAELHPAFEWINVYKRKDNRYILATEGFPTFLKNRKSFYQSWLRRLKNISGLDADSQALVRNNGEDFNGTLNDYIGRIDRLLHSEIPNQSLKPTDRAYPGDG